MRPRRHSTRFGRSITAAAWLAAGVLAPLACCWMLAGLSWRIDLVANLNAQWLLLGTGAAAAMAALRRWKPLGLTLGACALLTVSLVTGRAEFTAPHCDSASEPADGAVRLFHYNASTEGGGPAIEAVMEASHADVLSVLCPPPRQHREVIDGDGLADRYPGKLVLPWRADPDGSITDRTGAFLVSRWPLRAVDTSWTGDLGAHLITAIVERPGGEFVVITAHPRSPRTAARWAFGNRVTATIARVAAAMQRDGYAVIVLADLNSTPSGFRSRSLWSEAGLRRCKPLLAATGTYPLPLGPREDTRQGLHRAAMWPLSVAIDDALVSRDIELASWGTLPRLDSEHLPVVVDVRIPARPAATRAAAPPADP